MQVVSPQTSPQLSTMQAIKPVTKYMLAGQILAYIVIALIVLAVAFYQYNEYARDKASMRPSPPRASTMIRMVPPTRLCATPRADN